MQVDFSFNDLIDILDGEEFEERPVDLRTFVTSPDYLGLPPLSEYQYTLIEKSSQIYKESTLIKLYGEKEGQKFGGSGQANNTVSNGRAKIVGPLIGT